MTEVKNISLRIDSIRHGKIVWVPFFPRSDIRHAYMDYPIFKGDAPQILERVKQIRQAMEICNDMIDRQESQMIMQYLIRWIDKQGGERSRGEGKRILQHAIKYLGDMDNDY